MAGAAAAAGAAAGAAGAAAGWVRAGGVVGAGQMGGGIAQLAAQSGRRCVLVDPGAGALERGLARIRGSLERLAAKGRLGAAGGADEVLARIEPRSDLAGLAAADFVIEAAPEDEALKRRLFAELDGIAPPHAVLATNTSSISVTRLAAATRRPERCVGMHFMNPPPLMQLVELIRGMATSEATFGAAQALAGEMGKTTCVSEDRPGFIVNRVLMPMINEAFYTLMEGVGSPEDIDAGMKLGTNQPMGPLTLADFIGLDTCLAIMRILHGGLGDSKYRPCPLLVQHVDAGWLGKKAGRGVYRYDAPA